MAPSQFDDFADWVAMLSRPSTLIELAALAMCAALAWAMCAGVRRSVGAERPSSIWFGRRLIDGVMFPLVWLCLAFGAKLVLAQWTSVAMFRLALAALVALVVIRVVAKVLHAAFAETTVVRMLERSISWIAWGAVVLWVSGLLPLLLDELDQIHWKVGGSSMSVRTLIEGTLTAVVVLILSLWISAAIESRLLRSATGGDLSLRKAFSNAARAFLLFVGLLVALTAVGIDLTALSVLGGAIGVGIGLGLQRLAANYVSGFVILAERSVRIGDSVRVDGFEGVITDINARYSVVRALAGRESIVPNEMFVVNRVENLSLSDHQLCQPTMLLVANDSDVDLVIRLLVQATLEQERVLRDPAPQASLSAFAADGLEFTVGYWIADPHNGQLNLRSAVNLAILHALREHGVRMPAPQRPTELPKSP
ncbi:MAG: mechanosensitive ion channel [Rhodoferax sp.]|nr:mechanosensitive ion channel [Rhodoferax sp.]